MFPSTVANSVSDEKTIILAGKTNQSLIVFNILDDSTKDVSQLTDSQTSVVLRCQGKKDTRIGDITYRVMDYW